MKSFIWEKKREEILLFFKKIKLFELFMKSPETKKVRVSGLFYGFLMQHKR